MLRGFPCDGQIQGARKTSNDAEADLIVWVTSWCELLRGGVIGPGQSSLSSRSSLSTHCYGQTPFLSCIHWIMARVA